MNNKLEGRTIVFRGRLSWLSYIKFCALGGLGASAFVGIICFALGMLYALLILYRDYAIIDDRLFSPRAYFIILYIMTWIFIGSLLVGLLGYPLYKWISEIKGGMLHTAYLRKASDRGAVKQFIGILSPCLKIILVTVFLCLIVMTPLFIQKAPAYKSTATVLLSSPELAGGDQKKHTMVMRREMAKITSDLIMSRVYNQETLNRNELETIIREVSVDQVYRTSMIAISVVARDANIAADMANALTREYAKYSTSVANINVEILERARPTTEPRGPRKEQVLIIGSLAGIALGLLIAVIWSSIRAELGLHSEVINR